jgi:hypothetical protein
VTSAVEAVVVVPDTAVDAALSPLEFPATTVQLWRVLLVNPLNQMGLAEKLAEVTAVPPVGVQVAL